MLVLQQETTGQGNSQGCRKRIFANDLGKTKITKFYCQVLIHDQDVLRFDVAMDNPAVMLGVY